MDAGVDVMDRTRGGKGGRYPPGKSQVAIDFLRHSSMEPTSRSY